MLPVQRPYWRAQRHGDGEHFRENTCDCNTCQGARLLKLNRRSQVFSVQHMGIRDSNQITRFISGFHLGLSWAGSLHSAESYIPHLTPPQLCSLVRRHGSLCPDISRSCNCSYLPPFSETWKWSVTGSPPCPLDPAHPLALILPHSASTIISCLLSCPLRAQCQAECASAPPLPLYHASLYLLHGDHGHHHPSLTTSPFTQKRGGTPNESSC